MIYLKNLSLKLLLYIVLSAGSFIVLLPLFWMVIAACKREAMEFRLWPSSHIEGPAKRISPLSQGKGQVSSGYEFVGMAIVASALQGKAQVTFEYDPARHSGVPSSGNVYLASDRINNWVPGPEHELRRDGDVWSIALTLNPGRYEYRFFIADTGTVDQCNPLRSKDGRNSVIVLHPGFNENKPLTDATRIEGPDVVFKISRPGARSLKVRMGDGRLVPLEGDGKGKFTARASVAPGETVSYCTLEPQPIREGLRKMYTLGNFRKVLENEDFPFGRFFLNSLVVATGSAFLTVVLCTMGGYVFAKKNFLFKDQLFVLLLSTMMIPGMIFMVPQFAIVNKLHWMNSYQGMIVPHLANIFGLFLLKQYISTIPDSLFEAAKIDGAGELQIFKIVVIPLSLPIMTTLFLLTFVGQWGNFLWQLIVNTPDSSFRTLPVGLALFKGQYSQDWGLLMAGACFSIIPIAVLFLLAQRFFIEGMTTGAIKE